MDEDKMLRLSIMIDKLTTTSKQGPDDSRLKELKKLCKSSEEIIRHTYHLLIHQLQKQHSEVRLNAVVVINELFRRSHVFRELLVSDFQQFMELTVETDPEQQLPPPNVVAKTLKKRTLEFIQNWYRDFGEGYKKLSLGHTFLRQCKQVDFNDMEARNAVERQRVEIRQRHIDDLNKKKSDEAVEELDSLRDDIADALVQFENCFRLLMPHPDEFFVKQNSAPNAGKADLNFTVPVDNIPGGSKKSDDEINVPGAADNEDVREHGMPDKSFAIEIDLSNSIGLSASIDNSDVIEAARDLYKIVAGKYKPALEKLINVFTKTGKNLPKLREGISMKENLSNAIDKFHELNIPMSQRDKVHGSDSEDDDFEEVPEKEGYEPVIPQHLRAEYGLDPLPSSQNKTTINIDRLWKLDPAENEDASDPTTLAAQPGCSKDVSTTAPQEKRNSSSSSLCGSKKAKLLDVAPRLRYDMDLFVWEEENLEPPAIIQYESLHKFWTPISNEGSTMVKEEDVASMRHRIIDFSGKFERVKWMCRTPLRSGRLCPRQDRKKCPFHGPIIPRDAMGNPANESDKKMEEERRNKEETAGWQDPRLLADIKAATGVDLIVNKKGKGGKRKKGGKKNTSDLTDIKKTLNTARSRLEKKVLNKYSLRRVEESINSEKQKMFDDKFGNQWTYSFNT